MTEPSLSPRQLDVLRLSADRRIRRELGITYKAVAFHSARAARRLGVTGRTDAIARAGGLGLLPGREA